MKTTTRYVTSRLESGIEVVSVSLTPFKSGEGVRVDVPIGPDTNPDKIRNRAIALAQPLLPVRTRLEGTKAPSPLKPLTPKPPDELVFSPEEIMPYLLELLPMMAAVAGKPIRLELTSEVPTASTDCKAIVNFNPEPFLMGRVQSGQGRGLHEASHIAYSPEGVELLTQAQEDGQERLVYILNLMMDRRDDDLNCRYHRGYARMVRRRLADLMPGPLESGNGASSEARTSVYIDFAYACKKHTRPRHRVVWRVMKIVKRAIKRVNDPKRPHNYGRLLTASKEVKKLLDLFEPEPLMDPRLDRFVLFMSALNRAIRGKQVSGAVRTAFRAALSRWHTANRKRTLQGVTRTFNGLPTRATGSGFGTTQVGRVYKVTPNPAAYAPSLARVRQWVAPLRRILFELALPEARVERGLDEGELDFDALSVLVTGGRNCMKREDEELKLDVAMCFVNDVSSSRGAGTHGTDLGVAFNEALLHPPQGVESHFLAFHDDVFDCGAACPNNGIAGVQAAGSTNEASALREAGRVLAKSGRRRKLVFVACDGGPNDPRAVERECRGLMAAGILPVRLLIGVDAAPRSYPIELFFSDYAELFRDLHSLFRSLLAAARS